MSRVQAYTKNGTPIPIENFVKTSDALGTGTDREIIIGDGAQGNIYKGSGVVVSSGGVISNIIVPLATLQYSGADAYNFLVANGSGEFGSINNPPLTQLQHDHSNAAGGGNLSTAALTSGQLALARGGSGADLNATGGANQIVRQNSAGGVFTVSVLAAADIPNLDAAKVTTGTLATARGGSQLVTLFHGAPNVSNAFDIDLSSGDALNCIDLEGWGYLRSSVVAPTTDPMYLFFNADTTITNYRHAANFSSDVAVNTPIGGNNPRVGHTTAGGSPTGDFACFRFSIPEFRNTGTNKLMNYTLSLHFNAGANTQLCSGTVFWNSTAAITALKFRTDNHPTDTFDAGSAIHLMGTK